MDLVDTELSEPYNYYTYRYFLNDWCAWNLKVEGCLS
jgi:hypothetical protein